MAHLIDPARVEPRFQLCARIFSWLLCLALLVFAVVNGICIATTNSLPISNEVTSEWGPLPDVTMCPYDYPVKFAFGDVRLEAESRGENWEGLQLWGAGRQASAADVNITVDEQGCIRWLTSVLTPTFKRKSTSWMLLTASFKEDVKPLRETPNSVPNIELAFNTHDYLSPLGDKFAFANVNQYPVASRFGTAYGFHMRKTLHVERFLLGSDLIHAQFDAEPRDIVRVQRPSCPKRPVAPWAVALDPCTKALTAVSTFFDVLQRDVPVIVRHSRLWMLGRAVHRLGNLLSVVAALSMIVFSRKNKTAQEARTIDAMTLRGRASCELLCGCCIEDGASEASASDCDEPASKWEQMHGTGETP